MKTGVLALQGSFYDHVQSLKLINHRGPDSQKLYLYNQKSKISKLADLNIFKESSEVFPLKEVL